MNRSIAAGAAVVIAVVAFFVARSLGGNDDGSKPSASAPAKTSPSGSTGTSGTPTATTENRPTAGVRTVLRIRGGQPVGGVRRIVAKSGDPVRIVVRSDGRGQVHLHGYDIEKEVAPGKPVVFAFKAKLEGVFDIELHPDTKLANLAVEP
jgi:hypothetical protein